VLSTLFPRPKPVDGSRRLEAADRPVERIGDGSRKA
jgi:hypothetical protein